MTNQQQQVRDWMLAFGQETPEKPCVPSLEVRKLRAKLILEEAMETIAALGMRVIDSDYQVQFVSSRFIIEEQMPCPEIKLAAIADGCEDLKVVTEGTLVACGLVKKEELKTEPFYNDPLFDEVMRSNWSKMWTEDSLDIYLSDDDCKTHHLIKHGDKYLVKDFSGKVIKPPSYSPPNLQPIIDELSKQIYSHQ